MVFMLQHCSRSFLGDPLFTLEPNSWPPGLNTDIGFLSWLVVGVAGHAEVVHYCTFHGLPLPGLSTGKTWTMLRPHFFRTLSEKFGPYCPSAQC